MRDGGEVGDVVRSVEICRDLSRSGEMPHLVDDLVGGKEVQHRVRGEA